MKFNYVETGINVVLESESEHIKLGLEDSIRFMNQVDEVESKELLNLEGSRKEKEELVKSWINGIKEWENDC